MNQKKTIKKIHGFAASLVVLLLALCLMAAPAAAANEDMSIPSLPMQMCGAAVDANGNPLPAGTVITATVDGITSTYVVKEEGKIGEAGTFGEKFLINGKTTGSTVTFAVNGVESGQTVAFGTGETVEQPKMSFDVVVEKTAATPAGNTNNAPDAAPSGDDKSNGETPAGSTAGDTKSDGAKTDGKNSGGAKTVGSGTDNTNPVSSANENTVDVKNTASASSDPNINIQVNIDTSAGQPVSSGIPSNPSAQASTPLPFVGIIAGLLAAGVLMRRNV